jgi:hypothetical protein
MGANLEGGACAQGIGRCLMGEQASREKLHQWAAEVILASSSLTDGLSDDEARPLIAWGLAQAQAAAQEMAAAGLVTAGLPGDDAHNSVADRLTPVRRIMKGVTRLASERHELSPQDLFEELQYLLELARGLPQPPAWDKPEIPLAELAGLQTGLDNAAFVQAILGLLESPPSGKDSRPQGAMEAGGEGDGRKDRDDDQ